MNQRSTSLWHAALVIGLAVAVSFSGHPAIALAAGLVLRISIGVLHIPDTSRYGALLLQTAIVLLGFRLSVGELWQTSSAYSGPVALYVIGTLALGWLLGRALRLSSNQTHLLSGGTAICGGTTIASLGPVLNARAQDVGVALAIVFLLNAVAILTFPPIGHWLGLTQQQFGVWAALAIHDTSSVLGTAAIYGDEALETATTVKLIRTLWLVPLIFVTSIAVRHRNAKLRIPLFVILFVAAAALRSTLDLPAAWISAASTLSKWLLVLALFFIGLTIDRSTLRSMRGRMVAAGVLLWLLLAPAVLAATWFFLP